MHSDSPPPPRNGFTSDPVRRSREQPDDEPPPQPTSNLNARLAWRLMAVGVFCIGLIFLNQLLGGWCLWPLLVASLVLLLDIFHYLTGGRAMMQATEAEREAAQRKAETEQRW
jgi:hypothetical protein